MARREKAKTSYDGVLNAVMVLFGEAFAIEALFGRWWVC